MKDKTRREFSLEGTGFTLRECGCSIGLCDGSGVKDGTCRVQPQAAKKEKPRVRVKMGRRVI